MYCFWYFLVLADPNVCTYGEKQTAVHYAAKNDAVDSLRVLIKLGCDKEVRDAKERTPLHTASELGIDGIMYCIYRFRIKKLQIKSHIMELYHSSLTWKID